MKKKPEALVAMTVRIPVELKEEVVGRSNDEDRAIQSIVVRALRLYLQTEATR
jgi:hypothetical protein